MRITGSCHCGNLSFVLDWRGDADAIPARACTCSFCRKHGAVWTADPAATLEVQVRDAAAHSTYRFETATADFHVCARCGAVPLVTSDIEGRVHAVVNVNAFDDVDPSRLRRSEVSFDGEETGSRLARRQRGWIGQVRFAPADRT
ncbi:GFA family protein [Dokdonella ginsengisoli]